MGDTIHERKRPRTTRETVSVSGVSYIPDRCIANSVMGGRMRSSQEELSKSDLLTKYVYYIYTCILYSERFNLPMECYRARSNVEKTRHVESKQAETYREKWQRAISTVMAQNAKMKIERVESDGNDGANMYSKWQKQPVGNLKDVFDAKRNILKTYQDAMDRGPASCKYTDGKKKSSKSSR